MSTDARIMKLRMEAAEAFVRGGADVPQDACRQEEFMGITPARCQVVAVASGKGGTSKTFVTVNLAIELARTGLKVALIDADFGMANAHLLMGIEPRYDISNLLFAERTLDEVIEHGPMGVRMIAGGSCQTRLAICADSEMEPIMARLAPIEDQADIALVDLAAGVSQRTARFLTCAHDIILVANHEVTSRADVISTLGMLADTVGAATVHLVVNMARDRSHATVTFQQIWTRASRMWRGRIKLFFAGWIPQSRFVQSSIMRSKPVVIAHPQCLPTDCIKAMAARMGKHHSVWRSRQVGRWSAPSAFAPIAGVARHPVDQV
ncbi:MAG: P-loop NTPase [Candidatus Portnoybacteria bacterium]|nr:P-loop NTPase [Candidatus Portnoybacteria bacterium]